MREGSVLTPVCLSAWLHEGRYPMVTSWSQVPSLVSGPRSFLGGVRQSLHWSCPKSCPKLGPGYPPVGTLGINHTGQRYSKHWTWVPLDRTVEVPPPLQTGQGISTAPQRTRMVVQCGWYASCVHSRGLSC